MEYYKSNIESYKRIKKNIDPFELFDIITDCKFKYVSNEAIYHLNNLYGGSLENGICKFRECGEIESMYFTLKVEFDYISFNFLDEKEKNSLSILKGIGIFSECHDSFHNDRYRMVFARISMSRYLLLEKQIFRNKKLEELIN